MLTFWGDCDVPSGFGSPGALGVSGLSTPLLQGFPWRLTSGGPIVFRNFLLGDNAVIGGSSSPYKVKPCAITTLSLKLHDPNFG